MEEKTYVDDIDRSIYDIKNDEKGCIPDTGRADAGNCHRNFKEKKGSFLDGNFQAAVPADI